jgi:hypothetical protein
MDHGGEERLVIEWQAGRYLHEVFIEIEPPTPEANPYLPRLNPSKKLTEA